MATHVNIGEAKTRLSELVAAAIRGEEIVLDKAGLPQVRLVPVASEAEAERQQRIERRRSAFGMWKHMIGDRGIDMSVFKVGDAEWDEHYRTKFGDPD